jgi:hypothetical protein
MPPGWLLSRSRLVCVNDGRSLRQLEQCRRAIVSKLDRGHEDLVEGKFRTTAEPKIKGVGGRVGVVEGEKTN